MHSTSYNTDNNYVVLARTCGNSTVCLATKQEACCSSPPPSQLDLWRKHSLVPRPSLLLASAITILEAGKKELVKREEGLVKLVT